MKRISRLGPLTVVHNGSHFEMPDKPPTCHGFENLCECHACLVREAKRTRARIALPWEEDYREAA